MPPKDASETSDTGAERISEAEHAVMEALWQRSPQTAAEVCEAVCKARQEIRRIARDNPGAAIIVTGCAVEQPQPAEEAPPMKTTNRHFFNTQFGDVHYIDVGSSENPPLVLLHQTPRSIDEFADVIPLLAAEHRVVAMDNPGYGCSDIPPRQRAMLDFALKVCSHSHEVEEADFEAPDASTNISPWGIIIGGEELHNNHHTYPTSAKLSVKPYEFDIGWLYIRTLELMGLAKVRKTPPMLKLGAVRPVADDKTLEAIIANRYEVMANYAVELKRACAAELVRMKAQGTANTAHWKSMNAARRWLHRDDDKIPQGQKALLARTMGDNPSLGKLVAMREELRSLWTRTNVSAEQLVVDLQAWCKKAEESGITALQEFSLKLRSAHA